MRRRIFAASAGMAGLAAAGLFRRPAWAQAPQREVRLIVPVAPGGTIDAVARLMAQGLSPQLGQPIVVENRSGAAFFIGLQAVANAAPDGHALGIAPLATLATAPILPGMAMPIDPDTQLQPVVGLFRVPLVLVTGNHTGFGSVADMLRRARARPGAVSIGNSGNGTTTHLVAARLAQEGRAEMLQVAYRGGTPALTDLMGGNVDLYFGLLPEVIPFIRDGRMKALAVASLAPNPNLPGVPPVAQDLPGFSGAASYGIVAPARMPAEWVAFWNRTLVDFLHRPEIRGRMEGSMFLEIAAGTTERYRQDIAADRVTWGKVIRDAGIRAD